LYCPSAVQPDPGRTLPISVLLRAMPPYGPDEVGDFAPAGEPAEADPEDTSSPFGANKEEEEDG